MQIQTKQDAVTRIDLKGFDSNFRQHILFLSDIHIDSPFCDTKLLKRHLDEAREKQAIILIAGDLFDGMQGQNDPRRSYKELKSSLKGIDYFDRVLDETVDFFKPYAENLAMLSYGNHEYAVVRHNGTDLVQRFVVAMRQLGSPVVVGGYGGFVRISVYADLKTPRDTIRIWYNHGAGGEAALTKGLTQASRQLAYIRGVDVIWNGHNHQEYISHQATLDISNKDSITQGMITFLRTPGYKNEYGDSSHGFNGFAPSRMMSPTPRGCVWGELTADRHKVAQRYYADVM